MLQNHSKFYDPQTDYQKYWSIDRNITFLNHGSFGACPLPVLQAQQQIRDQIEKQPLHFFNREYETLIDNARSSLAAFIGSPTDNLVFVPNATTGINAILRSLEFQPGDELLTTNQEYNASRNVLDFVAQRCRSQVVVAQIPFPITSPAEIISAIMECVSPRTKFVLLDHITSQTALIFPIKQIITLLAEKGIDTLVDGAHAPGMIPLNLQEIGATYYTGNCHKWLCAPKGSGFLYVRKDKQKTIRPTIISHGANSLRQDRSRFQLEFDWMGTSDPSPYLCIPVAIEFMRSLLGNSWQELMQQNHAMALAARKIICNTLNINIPCPDEFIGSMASIPLPQEAQDILPITSIPALQNILWDRFQIEVPIIIFPQAPKQLIRISAQIYNTLSQYEYLANALNNIINN